MKYTAVSVRQLDRKGKPWQARAKYKDVYGNEFLLILHQSPVVGIECPLSDIAEYLYLFIVVSTPDNAACPLFQVGRTDFADNLSAMPLSGRRHVCAVCFPNTVEYGFSWRRAYNTLPPLNRA